MTDTHVLDNPHAISDVACACGCDTLMTVGWLNGGNSGNRRFLYGHKPTEQPKPSKTVRGLKHHTGPEQIEAYFTAQIESLTANGSKLKGAAQKLLADAKEKMRQAQEIDEQITKIKTVREQTKDALGRIFKP